MAVEADAAHHLVHQEGGTRHCSAVVLEHGYEEEEAGADNCGRKTRTLPTPAMMPSTSRPAQLAGGHRAFDKRAEAVDAALDGGDGYLRP